MTPIADHERFKPSSDSAAEPAARPSAEPNVQQAVPFLMVANLEASLRFYTEGLGFTLRNQWIDRGRLRWCWLDLGRASLMLQEYLPEKLPSTKRGEGVSLCFQCRDALELYRQFLGRGLSPNEPFVGNAMWVTILTDPDGYKLDFESPTSAPEESTYSSLYPGEP
jgi:lactoylglutathione lyase